MRVGIDIGGTKIGLGLVDESGTLVDRQVIPTERGRGYEEIRSRIVGALRVLAERNSLPADQITLIGCGCAGQVDPVSGSIIFSPNLGWVNVPLKEDLEKAFGRPVIIDNDVNAATYGEWRFGLKGVPRHVTGIFIGTGIGGGLIFDGVLYRGFAGVAAELGHMTLNPHGYQCRCGNRGCFEAYCGGSYVAERVRERVAHGYRGIIVDIIGGDLDSLHAGHVEEAWARGDPLCREVWDEVVLYFGAALQTVANLLNPEVIVCGGGVIDGTRSLIEEARRVMGERIMPASKQGLRIERASLGADAIIVGAAFIDTEEVK